MLEFLYSASAKGDEASFEMEFPPGGPEYLSVRPTEPERWAVSMYLATLPKKRILFSDVEVRIPRGRPEVDARKGDMAWCGNTVATAWKGRTTSAG